MATTRKDYDRLAARLSGEYAMASTNPDPAVARAVRDVIFSLADYFAQDNARFNRDQFYTACGLVNGGLES